MGIDHIAVCHSRFLYLDPHSIDIDGRWSFLSVWAPMLVTAMTCLPQEWIIIDDATNTDEFTRVKEEYRDETKWALMTHIKNRPEVAEEEWVKRALIYLKSRSISRCPVCKEEVRGGISFGENCPNCGVGPNG